MQVDRGEGGENQARPFGVRPGNGARTVPTEMQGGCEKASFQWTCEVNANSLVGTDIVSAEEIVISVERKNGSPRLSLIHI